MSWLYSDQKAKTTTYKVWFRAQCKGAPVAWKVTGSIQRHRDNWVDPTVYWHQHKGFGSGSLGLGDRWSCEDGKTYNLNTRLNVIAGGNFGSQDAPKRTIVCGDIVRW